jgi:hypothetical protein
MKVAREFIFVPFILAVFAYIIYNAYGFVLGKVASVFLPTDNSINQTAKVFMTSMILLVLLEYFIYSNLPNNFFYSRMLALLSMVSLYIIWASYGNVDILAYVIIILIGSSISYVTQYTFPIKYQNYFALVILIMTIVYLVVISL